MSLLHSGDVEEIEMLDFFSQCQQKDEADDVLLMAHGDSSINVSDLSYKHYIISMNFFFFF